MKITVIGEETPDLVEELDRCRPTLEGHSPILAIDDGLVAIPGRLGNRDEEDEEDEQDEERLFEVTLSRTAYYNQHTTVSVYAHDEESAAELASQTVDDIRDSDDWDSSAAPYDWDSDYEIDRVEETD